MRRGATAATRHQILGLREHQSLGPCGGTEAVRPVALFPSRFPRIGGLSASRGRRPVRPEPTSLPAPSDGRRDGMAAGHPTSKRSGLNLLPVKHLGAHKRRPLQEPAITARPGKCVNVRKVRGCRLLANVRLALFSDRVYNRKGDRAFGSTRPDGVCAATSRDDSAYRLRPIATG